jgi:hypothetical protein
MTRHALLDQQHTQAPASSEPGTHQSEAYFVLATQMPQPLQMNPAVQLKGGPWTGDICVGSVPVFTKVELVEGIDILLGECIKFLQMPSDRARPGGRTRPWGCTEQSHHPKVATSYVT